jgi:hypothetical protein
MGALEVAVGRFKVAVAAGMGRPTIGRYTFGEVEFWFIDAGVAAGFLDSENEQPARNIIIRLAVRATRTFFIFFLLMVVKMPPA